VNFEEDRVVRGFWLFMGLSTSRAQLMLEYDDNGTWTEYVNIDFSIDPYADEANQLYRWFTYGGAVTTSKMRVTIKKPLLRMLEIGFKDTNGDVLPIMGLSEIIAENVDDPYKLIDEQELIPASYSYMNSFYFDEIYHVRTAWEHLNFIEPYETTHPPLGKVIISLGIKIFGMTPFGWRFMGTLFGTLMIPIMYMLTKAIFKKRIYAFVGMFLLTFDFMHFAQTRIATIDTYVVFFIMCSYLFMYIYYKKNYNLQSIKSTIFPLAMAGLFFGLSAASKWTGIYAGIGLGIIFFYSIALRYQEYLECSRGKSKHPHANRITKDFKKKTIITILICGVLFIIVPIIVYTASYIPYMSIPTPGHGLSAVWDNQINMYNYHSVLVAEHTYQSAWYTWPLNLRPVWFYSGAGSAKDGMVSSISTYGSPAVWWVGTLGVLYLLYLVIFKKAIKSRTVVFLSIGYLAQLLPWVPVTRCTFIYHYFPAVPFSILIIVYCMKFLNEKFKNAVSQKNRNLIIYGYLALVLIVFIVFFPTFSGILAPKGYIRFLQSIPSWFFGAF